MNQHHSRFAIDANPDLAGAPRRSEVTFIESNVGDLQTLLQGLDGKEVHILDAGVDGLQQIADILAGRGGIDAVHIITHGDSGAVDFGALTLDGGNLAAHTAALQAIGASLSADGDILLYGCKVGAGADGAALLQSLATLTGADIAASTNPTGAGGDWTLEARSGRIESAAPLSVPAMLDYHGTLATGTPLEPTVTGNYDSNAGSAQLTNGGRADLYLHQIGGNNAYEGGPPQYQAKVVLADGANHIVQTVAVSGTDYVANASVAKLVNGGFVVAWSADTSGAAGSGTMATFYQVYNDLGVAQGGAQALATVPGKSVALTALADGGFAAAFVGPNRADSLVVFGYNNGVFSRTQQTLGDGDSAATYVNDTDAASRVWSTSDSNGGTPSIMQLTDGSIVVTDSVYVHNSSMYTPVGEYAFKYTSAGVPDNFANGYHTQRLNWSVDIVSNSGQHAIALSGGGFAVVSLVYNTGYTGYELILLDNNGTPLNADTVTHQVNLPGNSNVTGPKTYAAQAVAGDTPDTNVGYGSARFTLTESSDGNILLALPNSSNSGFDIYTYTQEGVAVGAPFDSGITPTAGYSLEHPVLAPDAGGGFSLSYNESHYDTLHNSEYDYDYWLYTGTPYSHVYVPNAAPVFVGATTTAAGAQNAVAIDLASLLHADDANTGQTLTWSQNVAPAHGTLSFTGATATSGGADIAPGGTITYTPNAGYAGSDSFTVQVYDGVTSATRVITVNVTPTAPTTPVLAIASDSGDHTDHLTNSATLSFSGSGGAGDNASTVRVFVDVDGSGGYNSGDISGTAILSNGAWSVDNLSTSTLSDGTYHVYAATSAGSLNSALSAALDVTIDKTAPTITFSAVALSVDSGAAGDFITNTAAQTVTATLSAAPAAGDVVEGTIDGGAHWIDITSMVSGGALTWTGVTLHASDTLQLRVTDKAGNSSTPASYAYNVDSGVPAAPSTPTLSAASDSGTLNNDRLTSVTLPELTGTGEANASVRLYDENGAELGSTTADGSGNWTITSTSALVDGSHDLTVKQTDIAGNVSVASSALTVVIDTTAPAAIALSAGSATEAGATAGTTIATLSASDAHAVSYSLVAGSAGNDASNALFSIVGDALKPIGNLAVGTYHVYVDAADAAGNHAGQALTFVVANGPSVSSIVRADGGGASIVAGAATTVSYTVTFSEAVSGVDAGDFTLTTTGNAAGSIASITPSGGGGDTYTVTVTGLSGDGTLRLDLKASGTGIQNAGSTAIIGGYGAGGQVLILDHTVAAPTAPALDAGSDSATAGDGISSDATPTFSGHAEANASVRLYDTDGTLLGSTTSNGAGEWSITSGTLAQGTHTLTAQQTDRAGNVSAASTGVGYTLDTAAPTAIALGSGTIALSSAVNGATLTTLSSSDATSVQYSLALGDGSTDFDNGKFSIAGGNLQAAQNLSVGTYHIHVKATDAAGNEGLQSFTINVVDAPAVVSIVRAGGASALVPTAATSVSYTVTFSQAVSGVDAADFTLYSDGNATGTISAITPSGGGGDTYTVTVTGISGDGSLRLDLKGAGTNIKNGSAVDIVGGYADGYNFRLDHTPAAAPSTPAMTAGTDSGSAGDAITSNVTPVFTGTAEANATVKLYDTNGTTLLGSTTADGSGNWSITSATLGEGGHTLTAKQTDAAGNVSAASGGLAVVIDTSAAAPATPVLASASDSGTPGDRVTNVATPTITGTAEANATVKLYDSNGTTLLGTTTANGSGAWSIVSSTLADGAHTLTVKQTDKAGNVSAASAALTLSIDTVAPTAPSAPLLAAASDTGTIGDGVTEVATPVVTGTADANATVRLYDSNGTTVLGTATADGSGHWSITSGALSLGAHTLTAKQFDLAGNASPAGAALALTIQAPPAPPTTPPTTIDGVPVTQAPVTLPGGGTGTQIVIPVVTPGRDESSGSTGVADIPLATNGTANVLLAQVAPGFGLTATGGASQPAGSSTEQLIQAILAATPDHPSSDQGHLTGNGVVFLNQLANSVPLLVQTITPSGGATTSGGALTLTGTSTDAQHTALVIDTSNLAPGAKLVLNSVDFAAIVGAADVTGNTNGQILTGDLANQQFTVGAGSDSSVFSGGGNDSLVFNSTAAAAGPGAGAQGATLAAGTTILHGGFGDDSATFNGASADYTVESHDGYVVVTAKAQPNQHALVINAESLKFSDATVTVENRAVLDSITGLYQDVLGRQADYLGVEFWATAEKNGLSLGRIALDLIGSAESQAKHAMVFNGDSAHDVELLYQGIFSRASDADGLAFWVDNMAKGLTLEQVATSFLVSAESQAHKIGVQDWDFQMG
jgi:hypothetical protein